MKLETPFTGQLAQLGVRARGGQYLSLRGVWDLHPGAVVYHRPAGLADTTVIGEIQGLHTWAGVLYCTGMGAAFLEQVLKGNTHALSLEMTGMHQQGAKDSPVIVSGTVRAALLVRAADFGWTGTGEKA